MDNIESNPLVTFVVFSYNQETYIEEAIEGALSQTYAPLEIIISDDCSTDMTFEIIKKKLSNYVGPHTVKIFRNDSNLGVGEHFSRITEIASGDLLIASAGDDISLPERTEVIVTEWLSTSRKADMLHSKYFEMKTNGEVTSVGNSDHPLFNSVSEFINNNVIVGATEAWTVRLFDKFGPLESNVTHEDRTIGFRAALCGGIKFIDVPLVKYRLGGISQVESKDADEILFSVSKVIHKRYISDIMQNLVDLSKADPERLQYRQLYNELERNLKIRKRRLSLANGENAFSILVRSMLDCRTKNDLYLILDTLKYIFPFLYRYWVKWSR